MVPRMTRFSMTYRSPAIRVFQFITDFSTMTLRYRIAATKKHKKSLGRLVPTTDLGIALYKQGFDFCCYSGDVWVLRDALTQAMNTLRAGCKP